VTALVLGEPGNRRDGETERVEFGPITVSSFPRFAGSPGTGEESPDFIGHGASGNGGRGDPTESATETYRLDLSGQG
jgi:hypothetical protein